MKITEGYMPYLNYQTYYRIVGDITKPSLVLLHGGPGSTHNYFELLDSVACDDYCVVMYDQLGCGNSYVEGRPELWKPDCITQASQLNKGAFIRSIMGWYACARLCITLQPCWC